MLHFICFNVYVDYQDVHIHMKNYNAGRSSDQGTMAAMRTAAKEKKTTTKHKGQNKFDQGRNRHIGAADHSCPCFNYNAKYLCMCGQNGKRRRQSKFEIVAIFELRLISHKPMDLLGG